MTKKKKKNRNNDAEQIQTDVHVELSNLSHILADSVTSTPNWIETPRLAIFIQYTIVL